ncbi:MAG: hypothetical protein V4510_02455 [bacterium]
MRSGKFLAVASLAVGVVFYLGSVGGMLWGKASPPADVGVVSTSAVFVLFGVLGLMLKDDQAPQAP